jgi:hypothetical protein
MLVAWGEGMEPCSLKSYEPQLQYGNDNAHHTMDKN